MAEEKSIWKKLFIVAELFVQLFKSWHTLWAAPALIISVTGAIWAFFQDHIVLTFASSIIFSVVLVALITWGLTTAYHKANDIIVATAFRRLDDVYLPFEAEVLSLFTGIARDKRPPSKHEFERLVEKHINFLIQICNTASSVLAIRKFGRNPLELILKEFM